MATLESLGMGSGVLTTDLIDKLVQAERKNTDFRLDQRKDLTDAKITAYGEISSMLAKVQSTAIALSSPTLTGATKVTSSDASVLTAEGGLGAEPGTYSVEVLNTAKSHSLASGSYSSVDTIIGSGKLVFNFGELEYDGGGALVNQNVSTKFPAKTITLDSSNNTLAGVRDSINSADMGIKATIVNDGSGYRLQLTSSETGKESAMTIRAYDSNDNPLESGSGLGALAYNVVSQGQGLTQTNKGEDAQLRVNGLTISRASNNIDEVVKGVTLNLHSADVGKNINITVSADTESLIKTIQGFVDTYNDLKGFVDDLSKFDAAKQQGGLLMGDATVRGMMDKMRALISEPIVGINGKYRSLTELGVNTNQDNKYLLDFDTNKLTKAMTEDRLNVIGMLAKTGKTTDSQIIYMNDSINTKPGKYDVNITQLASQAKYQGNSLALLDFSSPVLIDSSNNKFTINVNGQSAAVELQQGSYSSGADLAKQIALQINSNDNMAQFGHSVSVDFNSANKSFDIISNLYGSASKISFSSVSANTANTLGFTATGTGTYQGQALTTLNAEAFAGKGATTLASGTSVNASAGIDFAANNASFSLSLDGAAAVAVTVAQKAFGVDLNGDGVYGDRGDSLQAIQNAIDATSMNGQVLASFDKNGNLVFSTTAIGASKSIQITQVGASSSDTLLGLRADQGVVSNGKDVGLTLGSNVEFKVQVDGKTSDTKVSVPAGTYATGNDLAAAVNAALTSTLSADPQFAGVVKGASTSTGSRDLSAALDFSSANAGFRLNVNGVEKEIRVTGNSGNNLTDIQTAIDAEYGAGVVVASLDGNGLKLATAATGHNQYVEVMGDGRGAKSTSFADLSAGLDFTQGNNATFTLTVDGVALNVNVNGKGNNSDSNLNAIQTALNLSLEQSGQFKAGDIQAKVDDSGKLYFETLSKNGTRTAATFGATAALEVSNANANAVSLLGVQNDTVSNGYDGFGLTTKERTFGADLDVNVAYNFDATTQLGSLDISIGGAGSRVRFTELDSTAISFLGLQDAEFYQQAIVQGKDVEGTINGVTAKGEGQFLRAQDGNEKATNGYYLGVQATDFSTSVELDANNSKFKINIDGVEAEVQLNFPATYNSGEMLAAVLGKAINDTAAFKEKGIAVKVDFTNDPSSFAHQKFGIISTSVGATSSVKITEASAGAASVFGFVIGAGDGEAGKAQVGNPDVSSGLRVKVTGGALGARGTVTYISGFGNQLKSIMDSFLNGSKSIMTNRKTALDSDLKDIESRRTRLNERMDAMEIRLKTSFQYNDAIVARLNSTLDFVKMQFEAMANSKRR